MDWSTFATLLLFLGAIPAGYLGGSLRAWSLHRRTYTLECAVTDLEHKILHEVKKRAGHERQSEKNIDREILEAAKSKPAQPELPWFMKYANRNESN
jgi:cell division protein FtsL